MTNYSKGNFKVRLVEEMEYNGLRFFKAVVDEKDAREFLDAFETSPRSIDAAPLVFECSDYNDIYDHLRDYQLRLEFNRTVNPLNVYRCLEAFGTVVQLVAEDEEERVYFATMHTKDAVQEIKSLRLDAKGIFITSLKQGQQVPRPAVELRKLMEDNNG